MIEIDDKIVSADLLREYFACDLGACKGICCVEGNAGAPLEMASIVSSSGRYIDLISILLKRSVSLLYQ